MSSEMSENEGPESNLSARLTRLEERMSAVEQALTAMTAPSIPPLPLPPPPSPTARPIVAPDPGSPPSRVPPAPDVGAVPTRAARRPMPAITAEMALRWAGVVLVVFAALFLVSTAITRGWIGPRVQLALATAGGAALVATGLYLDRRWGGARRPWSLALANAGVIVLGLCAGAAHGWLELVTVGVSSALIVGVAGLAVGLAHWFDDQSVAITGLGTALVVPGLIGAYDAFGDLGTGLWLLALVVATMALAGRYRWSVPRLLGLVVIGPLMVALVHGAVDPSDSPRAVIQLVIVVAGLLWWLAPWLRPAEAPLDGVDQRLVFAVPGLVWAASFELWASTDVETGTVAAIVAAGFAATTALVWAAGNAGNPSPIAPPSRRLLFGYLVGISSLMSIALALWFEGPTLLSALAIQALGTVALVSRTDDRFLEVNAAALGVVVGAWAAVGLVEGVDDGLVAADAVVYLAVLLASAVAAWLIRHRWPTVAGLIVAAGWVGLLTWSMAVLRPLPQGQMIVSIVWAVLGVALVAIGIGALPADHRVWAAWPGPLRDQVKTAGLLTLAVTVIKLVTVDLAEVDTIWRALLFAVVGVGLLRLGYRMGLLERSAAPETDDPGSVPENHPRPL